jgi:hypothetical protein
VAQEFARDRAIAVSGIGLNRQDISFGSTRIDRLAAIFRPTRQHREKVNNEIHGNLVLPASARQVRKKRTRQRAHSTSWCARIPLRPVGTQTPPPQIPPAGFEPATCALGKRCSIQLSYEGVNSDCRWPKGRCKGWVPHCARFLPPRLKTAITAEAGDVVRLAHRDHHVAGLKKVIGLGVENHPAPKLLHSEDKQVVFPVRFRIADGLAD